MKGTNFDPVAPYYDQLAQLVFGKTLLRARLHLLSRVGSGDQVLVIGGGTGGILLRLLEQVGPAGQICYLELSEKMMSQAQDRFESLPPQIEWIAGTMTDLAEERTFDVVITNFFLDLFPTPEAGTVAHRILRHLTHKGAWILTDFFESQSGVHRVWGKGLVAIMYRFFGLICGLSTRNLPELDQVMPEEITLEEKKTYWNGMIQTRLYRRSQ